jgi:hypothetical protein
MFIELWQRLKRGPITDARKPIVSGGSSSASETGPLQSQLRSGPNLAETGPLSQGVQARRKALIIRYINGMEVRKKRPRWVKKRPRGFNLHDPLLFVWIITNEIDRGCKHDFTTRG